MPATHAFLCGTLLRYTDVRFVFDIGRLRNLFAQCSPTTKVSLYSNLALIHDEDFQNSYQTALRHLSFGMEGDALRNEVSVPFDQLKDATTFLQDIENLKVSKGDNIFIHMTDHGAIDRFCYDRVGGCSPKDVVKALTPILSAGSNVLLFISSCGSRQFASHVASLSLIGYPLEIVTDDPAACTYNFRRIIHKPATGNIETEYLGTEFVQNFLTNVSNMKSIDQSKSLYDFKTQMDPKFHGWMIQHRDKPITDWFGNTTSFVSPLVRCPGLEYTDVKRGNSAAPGHQPTKMDDISPLFHELLQVLLTRPVVAEDLENLERKELGLDEDTEYVQKMLDILCATRFILPGEFSGANAIYLLKKWGVTHNIVLKTIANKFPHNREFAPEIFSSIVFSP
eukprot:TRINITY_DN3063_c0_g1_i1.p1 TRINITY_DN3063_c0_g1~~TRINITY_DN3063_c0_g1_i1.p1  ORF type:complete len:402 (+),score=109.89 TRINITY_DN3063_c0_g1_i1:23-1207(+)